MSDALVLAIDNGTSSTKCLVVDDRGRGRRPRPGAGRRLRRPSPAGSSRTRTRSGRACAAPRPRRSIRRTAQTRRLGRPEHAARILRDLGPPDRRSADARPVLAGPADGRPSALPARGRPRGVIRRKSGLPLDPMFSAAKARWLLDRLPVGAGRAPRRARSASARSTRSSCRASAARRSSRPATLRAPNSSTSSAARWDEELLSIFDVPLAAMPRVVASTGPFPAAKGLAPLPDGVPVGAVMADSHSALFAHGAFAPGPVKATHGTGSLGHGPRRPQRRPRRRRRRAGRLPDARVADRRADAGLRGQHPLAPARP